MKLHYHISAYYPTNFGDALNAWLWPRLLPDILNEDSSSLFVGIGTLLNDTLPAGPVKAIFGTGVGYGKALPTVDERWNIYCLRGPLSAYAIGQDKALAITDSAVLVRLVLPNAPTSRYLVSFMPHCKSTDYWDWDAICAYADIHFINPLAPVEQVLTEIQSSQVVMSEAMHGAIVSDALRVPWVPVQVFPHILEFKWRDWTSSVNLPYIPERLQPTYPFEESVARVNDRLHRTRLGKYVRAASASPLGRLTRDTSIRCGKHYKWSVAPINDRRSIQLARSLRKTAETAVPTMSTDVMMEDVTAKLQGALDRFRADWS